MTIDSTSTFLKTMILCMALVISVLTFDQVGAQVDTTVTHTHKRQTGTIEIEKVTNPGGGAGYSFSGTIPGGPADFSLDDGQVQTFSNISPGSYTIIETDPNPSRLSDITCNDDDSSGNINTQTATINLQAGETVRCVFTNDRPGTITVVKEVPSGAGDDFDFTSDVHGGADFTLDDATPNDGDPIFNSHTLTSVIPGTYTITEADPSPLNFALSNIVCMEDVSSNSSVDIEARTATITVDGGENIECTFTNIKDPGTVIIIKETIQPHPQNFTFTTSLPVGTFTLDDPATDDGDGVTNIITYANVAPNGTYTITETDPTPYLFNLTGLSCNEDTTQNSTTNLVTRTATLTVEPNEVITCVFTNTAQSGTIIITKAADPANGTDFGFTSTLPGQDTFTLDDADTDDGDGIDSNLTVTDLDVGSYTVTESDPGQFSLNGIICDDPNSPAPSTVDLSSRTATLNLDPGETINCTFTNHQGSTFIYLPIIIK